MKLRIGETKLRIGETKLRIGLIIVLGLILLVTTWSHELRHFSGGVKKPKLTPGEQESLRILVEMNKLIISLALLVIGAAGALSFKRDLECRSDGISRVLVIAAAVCAMVSVYFGYDIYFLLVEMLSSGFFDLKDSAISVPLDRQRGWFLFSAGCLVLLGIHHCMWRRES